MTRANRPGQEVPAGPVVGEAPALEVRLLSVPGGPADVRGKLTLAAPSWQFFCELITRTKTMWMGTIFPTLELSVFNADCHTHILGKFHPVQQHGHLRGKQAQKAGRASKGSAGWWQSLEETLDLQDPLCTTWGRRNGVCLETPRSLPAPSPSPVSQLYITSLCCLL